MSESQNQIAQTRLPQDAKDTGYRLDGQSLWLAGDQSAAYVVTGPLAERRPAAAKFLGCA